MLWYQARASEYPWARTWRCVCVRGNTHGRKLKSVCRSNKHPRVSAYGEILVDDGLKVWGCRCWSCMCDRLHGRARRGACQCPWTVTSVCVFMCVPWVKQRVGTKRLLTLIVARLLCTAFRMYANAAHLKQPIISIIYVNILCVCKGKNGRSFYRTCSIKNGQDCTWHFCIRMYIVYKPYVCVHTVYRIES